MLRVLFFESHPMWIYGLPNGFRDAGHDVRVSGTLTQKKIQRLLRDFRPDLVITMGWTPEHSEQNQKWLRKYIFQSKVPHVYWATEDPTHIHDFTLPYVRAVRPDFVFTICRECVNEYRRLGVRASHLDFGFHQSVHRPLKVNKRYNIAVVANAYPRILKKYPAHKRIQSLRRLIRPLVQKGIRVDFWGRQWEQMKPYLGVSIPKSWIHGYLPYTRANEIYSASKIIIGLQNKPTQLTQRTYEILASGGFLLTNDTPGVRKVFKPNQHLIVSNSPQKTLKLVNYYLRNSNQRKRISHAGRVAVARHSYKRRALQMIRVLKAAGIIHGTGKR